MKAHQIDYQDRWVPAGSPEFQLFQNLAIANFKVTELQRIVMRHAPKPLEKPKGYDAIDLALATTFGILVGNIMFLIIWRYA